MIFQTIDLERTPFEMVIVYPISISEWWPFWICSKLICCHQKKMKINEEAEEGEEEEREKNQFRKNEIKMNNNQMNLYDPP